MFLKFYILKFTFFKTRHEIHQISSMKSAGFHEICNLPDFMHHKICWISWNQWNLADFMALLNADFMKSLPNEPRTHGPIFSLRITIGSICTWKNVGQIESYTWRLECIARMLQAITLFTHGNYLPVTRVVHFTSLLLQKEVKFYTTEWGRK